MVLRPCKTCSQAKELLSRSFPLALFVSAVAASSCLKSSAEPSYVVMGDDSPTFGSKPELSSLSQFVSGSRWCKTTVSDKEFAKQIGTLAIAEEEGPDPSEWYEFASDGTFRYMEEDLDFVVRGKWSTPEGTETINLIYGIFNDKPPFDDPKYDKTLNEVKEEVKRREESGTRMGIGSAVVMESVFTQLEALTSLKLAPDRKKLLFAGNTPMLIQSELGEQIKNLPPLGAPGLERMKVKN